MMMMRMMTGMMMIGMRVVTMRVAMICLRTPLLSQRVVGPSARRSLGERRLKNTRGQQDAHRRRGSRYL